jgi:hypothetical protein
MVIVKPEEKHPDYEKRLPQWERQRDAIEGEDAIKEAGDKYLPRLSGQSNDGFIGQDSSQNLTSYQSYKDRASFMNASGRTLSAMTGMVTRKTAETTWPEATKDADWSMVGARRESFEEVMNMALDETMGIGRYGLLVDMPDDGEGEPFIASYPAESITNWDEGKVAGRRVPVMINLLEMQDVLNSEGRVETVESYRVLHLGIPEPITDAELLLEAEQGLEAFLASVGLVLADFTDGDVYFQEVWEQALSGKDDTKTYIRTDVLVPRLPGGALWREIPFTFFNPMSTNAAPEKPQMLDLTVVNISHYRNSADLEHGAHFTALPQPWAAGFDFKGALYIGSSAAWVTENPDAKAGYLEFSGAGLGTLINLMERKEKQMAALGARLLEQQQSQAGVEAAETVRLRQSGEKSSLSRMASSVSLGLTKTLRYLANFRGMQNPDVIEYELNQDFGLENLDPALLQTLFQQVQSGLVSWSTYFWNLKRGELIPEGITEEDEAARIMEGTPLGLETLVDEEEEKEPDDTEDEEDEDEDEDEKKPDTK